MLRLETFGMILVHIRAQQFMSYLWVIVVTEKQRNNLSDDAENNTAVIPWAVKI